MRQRLSLTGSLLLTLCLGEENLRPEQVCRNSRLMGAREEQHPHPFADPSSAQGMLSSWSDVFERSMLTAMAAEVEHLVMISELQRGTAGKRTTFWKKRDAAPRCAVEAAVDRLTELVFGGQQQAADNGVVGAKFWANKRGIDSPQDNVFHVDKDEQRIVEEGVLTYPLFSGVLFLSDQGPPTVWLNQTFDASGKLRMPLVPTSAILAFPKRNRFVLARGDLVHGVDGTLSPRVPMKPRLTFIVSWEEAVPRSSITRRLTTSEIAKLSSAKPVVHDAGGEQALLARHGFPDPAPTTVLISEEPDPDLRFNDPTKVAMAVAAAVETRETRAETESAAEAEETMIPHHLGVPSSDHRRILPWEDSPLRIVLPLRALLAAAREGVDLHVEWTAPALPRGGGCRGLNPKDEYSQSQFLADVNRATASPASLPLLLLLGAGPPGSTHWEIVEKVGLDAISLKSQSTSTPSGMRPVCWIIDATSPVSAPLRKALGFKRPSPQPAAAVTFASPPAPANLTWEVLRAEESTEGSLALWIEHVLATVANISRPPARQVIVGPKKWERILGSMLGLDTSVFAEIDRGFGNGDCLLQRAELEKWLAITEGGRPAILEAAPGHEDAAALIQAADTNRDGSLSWAEFPGPKSKSDCGEKLRRI